MFFLHLKRPFKFWKKRKSVFSIISKNDDYEEWWHYLVARPLSTLLREISLKHDGGFFGLNCLNSFRTKTKLEPCKKVYENKDFCDFVLPTKGTKILEFIQLLKSDEMPYFIYADLKSFIKK